MTRVELFEKFISDNLNNTYRFAYSYVKNKPDAEDIVNESVVKALKGLEGLKNTQFMKPWFYKIISNTSISFLRKKNKVVFLDIDDSEFEQGVTDDYSALTFDSFIEKLDTKYKEVIILRYFEGMSLSEIAEVLETNENTVKTRLYRAQKILKQDVEEDLL